MLPRLTLSSAIGAALLAGLPAQRSDLKRALPADTIVMMSMPDLDTSIRELLDMPLMRMWRQDEVQGFLKPALAEFDKQWGAMMAQAKDAHEQGMLPFAPDDLLKLRLYGASVGLTGFRLVGGEGAEPMPDFGMVLHLDFGPSAPMWKKVIDFGLAQIEEQSAGMLQKSEATVGATKLTSWNVPNMDLGLNLAWLGDGIVFGTRTKEVQSVIAGLAAKDVSANSLVGSAHYKTVAKKLDTQGAEVEMFVNHERLFGTVFDLLRFVEANAPDVPEQFSADGIERACTALGLLSVKATGATSTYQGGKAVSKSYALSPAPERKGLMADGSKNLDLDVLKWVPKKAIGVNATTINMSAWWDALTGAIKAYDEGLAKQLMGQLAEVEKKLAFTVRDDLCGAFGSQMVSWDLRMEGMPGVGGGSLMSGMYLVQVKDAEKVVKCLNGLRDAFGGTIEFGENKRDDLTTYFVKFNVEMPQDIPFNVFDLITPHFGFQSGYMVLGFARSDVRKTMTAMANQKPDAESIRSNKEFADMIGQLKVDGLTSVSFSDFRARCNNIYELIYPFSFMVPKEAPLDMEKLPDEGGFLSQHLFPSVSNSYTDGNGFTTTSVSPFGPEMMAVAGALGVAAVGFGASQVRRFR